MHAARACNLAWLMRLRACACRTLRLRGKQLQPCRRRVLVGKAHLHDVWLIAFANVTHAELPPRPLLQALDRSSWGRYWPVGWQRWLPCASGAGAQLESHQRCLTQPGLSSLPLQAAAWQR